MPLPVSTDVKPESFTANCQALHCDLYQGRPPHLPLALSAELPGHSCGGAGLAEPTAFLSSAGMLQARFSHAPPINKLCGGSREPRP